MVNRTDKDYIIERYMKRFKEFGMDIRTLASGNRDRQLIRFKAFSEIGDLRGKSVLDIGCGFGDFYQYLKDAGITVRYTGIDITSAFVELCQERFPEAEFRVFDLTESDLEENYDFVVSSQAFNNNLQGEDNEVMIRRVLSQCYRICNICAAVDMMSSYVDFRDEHLYYYKPEEVFAFCKTLTKRVTLRHDYPLFEFMAIMYKDFEGWRPSPSS